jgi:hypothetical protein
MIFSRQYWPSRRTSSACSLMFLQQACRNGQPQHPPPPPPPPTPKSVKMVSKAGRDLNGATATAEEVHDGHVTFTGPEGLRIYFETWADGFLPRTPGITGVSGIIPAGGVLVIGGSATSLGPGLSATPMKCRAKWYYAAYGSSDYELVGDISWTEQHGVNLDWERGQANLTWDPYFTPQLTILGWQAAQLKTFYGRPIMQSEFDAIRTAFTVPGIPMPKDPYAMFAPGAPVA